MTKTLLPLAEARLLAETVRHELRPFCTRIEIAGSVRRESAAVGDIELVAIPRYEPAGLFGDHQQNALWAFLNGGQQAFDFMKGNNADGRYFQLRECASGAQIDLFLAQPSSFGWLLLMRTGPATFSQSVLTEWKRLKCIAKEGRGSVGGHLVDRYGTVFETPEEADVFSLIGVPVIPPQERTDDALQRVRAGR